MVECYWGIVMDNVDNVIDMFRKKSAIPEGETPDETISKFHSKLDEVLDQFQTFSVMEKLEVMTSVVELNKQLFILYQDLKKRHTYHLNNQ